MRQIPSESRIVHLINSHELILRNGMIALFTQRAWAWKLLAPLFTPNWDWVTQQQRENERTPREPSKRSHGTRTVVPTMRIGL